MRYQFDDYTLDTDQLELSKAGRRLPCEQQVIESHAFLVKHYDHIVSRDEINEHIWRDRIVS